MSGGVEGGSSLTPHPGQGEVGRLHGQYGGGYWSGNVSDVPVHLSRVVARKGVATLPSPPQSLHKGTNPCCGMLQCQH